MGILDIIKKKDPYGLESFSNFVTDDFYRVYKYDVVIFGRTGDDFNCKWIANTKTPSYTTSIQYINWMHSRICVPGKTVTNQWSVSIRDTADGKSYKYFNDWRNMIYTPIPRARSSFSDKSDAQISLIPPHALTGGPRGYILHGLFPFQIGETSLSPDDNNISIFNVDFVMDYFESFVGDEEKRTKVNKIGRGQ